LVVPVAPEEAPSAHTVMYTARRGDTLVTIADRFGVSLAQLRRWNSMTGTRVEPGRRIHVAEPTPVRRVRSSSRRRRQSANSRLDDPKPAGVRKQAVKTASHTENDRAAKGTLQK